MENRRNQQDYSEVPEMGFFDRAWRAALMVGVPLTTVIAVYAVLSERNDGEIDDSENRPEVYVDKTLTPTSLPVIEDATETWTPSSTQTNVIVIPTPEPEHTSIPEPSATPDAPFLFQGVDFENSSIPISLEFSSKGGESVFDGISVSFNSVRWDNSVPYAEFWENFRPGTGNAAAVLDKFGNMIMYAHTAYIKPFLSWNPLELEPLRDAIEGGGKTVTGSWTNVVSQEAREANLASVVGTEVVGIQGEGMARFTIIAAGYIAHEDVAEFDQDAADILEQTIAKTGGEDSPFVVIRGRDNIVWIVFCGWDSEKGEHYTTYSRYVLALQEKP